MLKTNLKTILIITLILILSSNTIFALSNDYKNHWASNSIEKLVNSKVISGYPDGTFKPDNSITRAEFITIISKIKGYSKADLNVFKDIKNGDWYYEAVTNAQNAGIVNGSNGMFRPLDKISRQEAVVILYRANKIEGNSLSSDKFTDSADIASWAKNQVSVFVDLGIIKGRSESLFAPLGNLTRAEAVKLIDNIDIYLKNSKSSDTVKQPVEPAKPVSPAPEVPKTPETPATPETPEVPKTPETPETPNTSDTYSVEELNGKVVKVMAGVYNVIFTEDFISYGFPTLKTTTTLNIKVNNSISTNYDVIYFDYIPAIDSPGWLAFNIQGASEKDILSGKVSIK